MERKAFGIDLGTTYSAIAVYEDGETQILKNAEGTETTPSVIFFTGVTSTGEDDLLVGQEAKNSAETEPDNVVQFIKRKMGQNGPAVNFRAPSGKSYTPEMLSSFILRKLCQDAEQYVGEGEIRDVVITVPAYFDDARRTATKQAGVIAGLNVLAVVNEPTAAAIAYGFGRDTDARVLVYDLGGGTFDVTIMDIKGKHFDTLATGGDSMLGGYNFDGRLSELIQKKLAEQGAELDDDDDLLFAEIREKAERAKRMLTDKETARLRLRGIKQAVEITREEFEEATADLLKRTQVKLEQVMADKNITWDEIDELLVIGGSTRMPMVKKMLESLSGKQVKYKVDPDTAVAQGAAIFASTFEPDAESGEPRRDARTANAEGAGGALANQITISDVTSQSLGVVLLDSAANRKYNQVIIPRNSKIPTTCSQTAYTVVDNQTELLVQVTEGNDAELEFVKIVGESTLSIPAYPKGSPFEIIYAYDPDQMVTIEVIDKVADKSLGTFEVDRSSNMSAEEVALAAEIVGRTNVE